jgi:hypothetical protein
MFFDNKPTDHWKKFSNDLINYDGPIKKVDWNKFKIEYNGCSILFTNGIGVGISDPIFVNFIVIDALEVKDMELINITKYISRIGRIWKHINDVYYQREVDLHNTKAIKDKAFVEEKLFGVKNVFQQKN